MFEWHFFAAVPAGFGGQTLIWFSRCMTLVTLYVQLREGAFCAPHIPFVAWLCSLPVHTLKQMWFVLHNLELELVYFCVVSCNTMYRINIRDATETDCLNKHTL